MNFPEIAVARHMTSGVSRSSMLGGYATRYEQCRLDGDFAGYIYRSTLLSVAVFMAVAAAVGAWLFWQLNAGRAVSVADGACMIAVSLTVAGAAFYLRLYSLASLKNYRGALIDANAIHAVGLMLAMAGYNVPLKRMLLNLSNLGSVYGQDIALEAAYALALIEEDGMDVISALREAQSTSPSAVWQELLIGTAAVYNSGGNLRDYLQGRYAALADKKTLEIRRYNEKVQGASSIYLSVIGIAAIFIAIINLVFNMAGMLAGDMLVWIDALVVVPAGSFLVIKVLHAAYPEAIP
ncbi:MAG TPA: type II secretion system protein F [Methanocella sp.]|jgi:archaellum biogenesis protein FlaJ (TadC family)